MIKDYEYVLRLWYNLNSCLSLKSSLWTAENLQTKSLPPPGTWTLVRGLRKWVPKLTVTWSFIDFIQIYIFFHFSIFFYTINIFYTAPSASYELQNLPNTKTWMWSGLKWTVTFTPKPVAFVELPGGVLPYMSYIGTCRGIGYGFWGSRSLNRVSFFTLLLLCSSCGP